MAIQTCPDAGAWRAWLDGESADAPAAAERHLTDCPRCARVLADVRGAADVATAAFARVDTTGRDPSAAAALQRFHARATAHPTGQRSPASVTTQRSPRSVLPWMPRGWRVAASGLAAVLALGLFAMTPEGRVAAASFLAQFRSQSFTVITFDPRQVQQGFVDLQALGTVDNQMRSRGRMDKVTSIAEASQRAGFTVKVPDASTLPAGVNQTPSSIGVVSGGEVRFTFDRTRAQAYFKQNGHPEVSVPQKFDGATLVVSVPSGVLLEYGGSQKGAKDALVVGQARELEVGVEGGVSLDELRDFLLGLPGLPPSVAQQLRAMQDWRNTVPIPIPVDQAHWERTTVAGADALMIADNSGAGSGIIWHRDNMVYGVAGTMKTADLQRIATSLR